MFYTPLNVSGSNEQLLCCKEIRLKLGKEACLETTCYFILITQFSFVCCLS